MEVSVQSTLIPCVSLEIHGLVRLGSYISRARLCIIGQEKQDWNWLIFVVSRWNVPINSAPLKTKLRNNVAFHFSPILSRSIVKQDFCTDLTGDDRNNKISLDSLIRLFIVFLCQNFLIVVKIETSKFPDAHFLFLSENLVFVKIRN